MLKKVATKPTDALQVSGNQVIALRKADLAYLSESDIECLERIISIYGDAPNWTRAKEAHDAAWENAWARRGEKKSIEIPVESIAEVLADSEDLINYLSNSDSG